MIRARREAWPIAGTFRIARGDKTEAEVVVVEIERGGVVGRGESVPYGRYGETVDSVLAAVGGLPPDVDRTSLQGLLAAGAARNAVDCALFDLEARSAGRRAWEIAGSPEPAPVPTAFTLSLDAPEAMAARAADEADRPVLKLKVGAEGVLARVQAVREAAPGPALIVDANESWTLALYVELAPRLAELGVALIEQPLPAGLDEGLSGVDRPVLVCADESCHTQTDLPALRGRYDAVNVKLDKAGGLTEALALARAAPQAGLGVMVGCMVGTSLGLAPATLLTPFASFVDLDGPLLLARDREPALRFEGSLVYPPDPVLWG